MNIKNIILSALLVVFVASVTIAFLPSVNAARIPNRIPISTVPIKRIVPIIDSLSPSAGPKGTSITIIGSGFTLTGNKIKFGNLGSENNPQYSLYSYSGTTLTFTVPYSNYLACWYSFPRCMVPAKITQPGSYQVSVINANGQSNAVTFTVKK